MSYVGCRYVFLKPTDSNRIFDISSPLDKFIQRKCISVEYFLSFPTKCSQKYHLSLRLCFSMFGLNMFIVLFRYGSYMAKICSECGSCIGEIYYSKDGLVHIWPSYCTNPVQTCLLYGLNEVHVCILCFECGSNMG